MFRNELEKYNMEIRIGINSFLNSDKKCLLIKTKSEKNCFNLIKSMETDYVFTDLFYNVENSYQLLYLLKQQLNPNKKSPEYGYFVNTSHMGINPFGIMQFATNFFKKDILNYEEQIKNQLKKINYSKVGIILFCSSKLSQELYNLILYLMQEESLESKFIIIFYDDTNDSNLYLMGQNFHSKQIIIEYSLDMLKNHFSMLSEEQIKTLISSTSDDIVEMQNIYNYYIESSIINRDPNLFLSDFFKECIQKKYNDDIQDILGLASFLLNHFSLEEIKQIYSIANFQEDNNKLKNILETCVKRKLLNSVNKDYYSFYAELLKNVFQEINYANKDYFHTIIEKYLKKYRPFQYNLRKYHFQEANCSNGVNNMNAMCLFHCLHFQKEIDETIKNNFISSFGEKLYNELILIYDSIDEGDFQEALFQAINLTYPQENIIFQKEINYLFLFLDWKTGEEFLEQDFKRKVDDIINEDCETETMIFTLLFKLSVSCNKGNNFKNIESPLSVYNKICKVLYEFQDLEADILLHILYRKSNAAMMRAPALTKVLQSFKFFSEIKTLYPSEYFMAGINYTALLLQSYTLNYQNDKIQSDIFEVRNPYVVATFLKNELSETSPAPIINYLMNNFLLSKCFCNAKFPTIKELSDFECSAEGINLGAKVMTYMNIGTIYALKSNYEKAEQYWKKAEHNNISNDEYFTYIIQNNRIIVDLIQNKNKNIVFSNEIPSIMKDNEVKQYMKKRKEIIMDLIEDKTMKSYLTIEKIFEEKFNDFFHNSALLFFSKPFIFSDVQFWSDN